MDDASFLPSSLAVCWHLYKNSCFILVLPFLGLYRRETTRSAVRASYAKMFIPVLFIKGTSGSYLSIQSWAVSHSHTGAQSGPWEHL
jgi:hypothetical protein